MDVQAYTKRMTRKEFDDKYPLVMFRDVYVTRLYRASECDSEMVTDIGEYNIGTIENDSGFCGDIAEAEILVADLHAAIQYAKANSYKNIVGDVG